MIEHKVKVCLFCAPMDKSIAHDVYEKLLIENEIEPWIDEENILPGQNWDSEIKKAIKTADMVFLFVSRASISKEGFVNRDLRHALDTSMEKPEGTIFIILLRLEDCVLPRNLQTFKTIDYFPEDLRRLVFTELLSNIKQVMTRHANKIINK